MSWREGASCGKNIRPVNHFVVGNMDNSFLCHKTTISANGKSFIPFPCRGHSIVLVKFASSKGVWVFICCGCCSLFIYSSSLIMSINYLFFGLGGEWMIVYLFYVCSSPLPPSLYKFLFNFPFSNAFKLPLWTYPTLHFCISLLPSPLNGAGLLSKLHLLQALFVYDDYLLF